MIRSILLATALTLPLMPGIASPAPAAPDPAAAIKTLLQQQTVDWNRGDLDAFASGYKNAPDILFMGPHPRHGFAEMLASYKARYSTREAMGTLAFSALAVHPLDPRIATATGNFHLSRSPAGGGDVSGYFLLVLERTSAGWKIVCDDTTVPPPAGK